MKSRVETNLFHYPDRGSLRLGRRLAAACVGEELWAAAYYEKPGESGIALSVITASDKKLMRVKTGAAVNQPVLASGEGLIIAAWNEFKAGRWKLKALFSDDISAPPETIAVSSELLFQPAAAFSNGTWWAAWSEREKGRFRVKIAKRENGRWKTLPHPVSSENADAFRPAISGSAENLFIAWDEYRGERYETGFRSIGPKGNFGKGRLLGKKGGKWFCPGVLAAGNNAAFLSWVVLREISDSRGIAEHFPFVMTAVSDKGRLCFLSGGAGTRVCADLREGLLASKTYLGYHGFRRRPFLCRDGRGEIYLLWEGRKESEGSHLSGYLAGRKLGKGDRWGEQKIFHGGHYGYCPAPAAGPGAIAVSYIDFRQEGFERLGGAFVSASGTAACRTDRRKWKRWKDSPVPPVKKPKRRARVGRSEYSLFWADTHCHCNFSPDAEGEPDELILFARDNSGIDAVSITDNDYYPHKALTRAEWEIQNRLGAHFSRRGEFLVFPGWEFTYHRKDLHPDFNHRIVLYPYYGGRMLRRIDPESDTDRKLVKRLEGSGALIYPHHPTYRIINGMLEKNAEVCSSWRVCLEETPFTINQLLGGSRLGFIGSSDTHRSVPGKGGALTGFFARELTHESIAEAFRERRTIATQGFPVFIDFRVGGLFIGEEGHAAKNPEISASVEAPSDIGYAEIVRDGKPVFRKNGSGKKLSLSFTDVTAGPGAHFYFLRVRLRGDASFNSSPGSHPDRPFIKDKTRYPHNLARARGVFAWTSPVWASIK